MKKFNWLLGVLLLALIPVLQSCDDDDGYSIGDFSLDWATVRTTGGGAYYLEGDSWGIIDPVTTAIPWYKPVDGERVIAFFNPLADLESKDGVQVKMEGIQDILTKDVEELTKENEEEFGNDAIVIYEGYMWLGGKYLNLIFRQDLPQSQKHRISLVENKEVPADNTDGYIRLELRYNTYDDVTGYWGWGKVSYNLEKYYPTPEQREESKLKGFKVKINSEKNGERTLILDFDHPVAVPDAAKDAHSTSFIR